MIGAFPLYLALWAMFPVLYLYVSNADQTTFALAVPPLVLSPLAFLGLYALVRRLFLRDARAAALFTLFLAFFFFSFGHIFGHLHGVYLLQGDRLVDIPFYGSVYRRGLKLGIGLFAAYGLAGWTLFRALRRGRVPLERITPPLTAMAALLIVFQAINFVGRGNAPVSKFEDPAQGLLPDLPFGAPTADGDRPDIYFVVPDGFARLDIVREEYGYDPTPFLNALHERGFQTPERTWASHYWTFLSLSSTLSMDYVTPYAQALGVTGTDRRVPYAIIGHNRVAQYLKTRGYQYVQTASTWGATIKNPFADDLLKCQSGRLFQTEFYRVLVETSALRPFLTSVGADLAACHLETFEHIIDVAGRDGPPRFVFAHVVPPHHPYLFDRDGNVVKRASIANQFDFQANLWNERDAYLDQLIFVSKKLVDIADAVIASKRKAVIIFASDHGPQLKFPDARTHDVRLANFVAVRSYDPSYKVPQPLALANLFRSVLAHHLKAPFPLLPSHSYWSGYKAPYDFREVGIEDFKTVSAENLPKRHRNAR